MIAEQRTAPLPEVPRLALSARELGEALGVCERTIASWVKAGDAPPSFIAPGGRLRLFPVDAAREWLRSKVDKQETETPGAEPGA